MEHPSEGTDRTRALQAVARATNLLSRVGMPSARVDAEILASHVLHVTRGRLALIDGFTADQLAEFDALVDRRAAGEPVQHLVGSAGFRHLELAVGPGVFVPRPETELLAGWAVTLITPGATVVDLCAGSGAIALAVANEVPGVRVYAVERSPAALPWLRRNAEARAAAGDTPIRVVEGDVTDPAVLADLDGTVDAVLCNPPYVPAGVAVPADVADHDPYDAVFAGADGLAVIRPVIARAAALLRPGGVFGVEHDDSHGTAVPALLRAHGSFTDIEDHQDLAGRPRYGTAARSRGVASEHRRER
ncbi:peptide chain release factor N(5)-glutamine methyltransferase [Phytohabitans houttuyneae]|uniref:peptide chain release factor N(5)-glutamine methyltransferase n=1 Tax=Phytohabitans houttuyneae TaxID=1076126 RepID=UPI001566D653